ncbi:Lysine biosynthesis regulatory protein LYS14 [Spathaspora sp. JA1]|nr:Lysine biosynthesis regulatory protein LYS14 [Spathaspora sp. JA1]
MSSGVLDLGTRVPQQKRVYSKGGCRECKRRKIKCDEGKPYCWQCLRLRKECTYPEVGEKVLRVSRKRQQEQQEEGSYVSPPPQQQNEGAHLDQREQIIERSSEEAQESTQRQIYQSPSSTVLSPINHNSPNATPVQRASSPHQITTGVPFTQPYPSHPFPHMVPQHQQIQQLPNHQPNQQQQVIIQPPQEPSSGAIYPVFVPNHIKKPSIVLPAPSSSLQVPLNTSHKVSEPPTKKVKQEEKPYSGSSILSLLNDTKASPASDSSITRKNGQVTDYGSVVSDRSNFGTTPTEEAMIELFDEQDLNVLAMDLNNMVSGLMFDMKFENRNHSETDCEDTSTNSVEVTPILSDANQIVRNLPLDCIRVKRKNDSLYLGEFYNEFSNIILPFSSYDEKTQCYFNPARDMILRNAADKDYLLAAVLANGARSLFLRTRIQRHEEVYCVYLSRCLKLLGPALSADDKRLTSNIESVLLTVLLLTTTNASNSKQDWRPHLKGGKDLLLKNSMKKIKSSNVLIFCKSWFVTLEILAGISSKHGGTLQTDEEIDLLINSGDEHEQYILKEMGIILENGFNIMGGYHNDCYDHFRDLIKILNRIRNRQGFDPQNSFEYMRLFARFQAQTEIEFVNKKGLLTAQDFQGPIPNKSLIDTVTINNKEFAISWMDVSHQSYVMASLITILSKCFQEPYTAPQIQLLTKSIVNFVSYLQEINDVDRDGVPRHHMKSGLMMLQWPMLVASNNLIDENLKSIASKFFQASSQIGSGGATIALRRVNKLWWKREKGFNTEEEDTEVEDLVSKPMGSARVKKEKKRGYSRGGCRECKRRKIKCDEEKPSCSQCARLQKSCSYPKEGEKVLRVSKKFLESHPNPIVETNRKPFTIQMYSGPDDFGKGAKKRKIMKKTKMIHLTAAEPPSDNTTATTRHPKSSESTSSIFNLLNTTSKASPSSSVDVDVVLAGDATSMTRGSPSSSVLDYLYNDEDLNLIAADLNNIVNDIMFTSNINIETLQSTIENDPTFLFNPSLVPGMEKSIPHTHYENDIPKNIPLDYIKLNTEDERRYLENFYNTFAMQILPFGAYDPITSSYSNPLRDVILKYASKEPFLLSAVLSQGAKLVSEQTNNKKDIDAYGSYLSTCLRLLGPALSRNQDKKVKDDLTSNVESILITVLLLTSSNASTAKQSWRPHLKGAKDIILKATHSKIGSSKTLILCKIWFADFEILAGQSSHLGGTLKLDEELDSVINFANPYERKVLQEFGMIQLNSYNIMFGYNTECVYLFRDLSKILNKRRLEGEEFIPNDSMEYIRLISGFHDQYNKVYIDKSCFISYVSHPVLNLTDTVFTESGPVYISWMDLTQQAYSLAGLITIFTQVFMDPPDLPHIKNLNDKLVSLITCFEKSKDYMKMSFPYGFSMIQWPISVAGVNCTENNQKTVIAKYFEICSELGSSSAEIALKRIKMLWELRQRGEEFPEEDEVIEIDSVAY